MPVRGLFEALPHATPSLLAVAPFGGLTPHGVRVKATTGGLHPMPRGSALRRAGLHHRRCFGLV
jgi:hypothetical protein